jgi:hypothetical protein
MKLHFSPETLGIAAALSGLKIINNLEGMLGRVEIGFIAENHEIFHNKIDEQIMFTERQVDALNGFQNYKVDGIFSLNGAGMHLSSVCNGKFKFIVDDNPAKQNSFYASIPVISLKEAPSGSTILVSYNSPELSYNLSEELKILRSDINFIVA